VCFQHARPGATRDQCAKPIIGSGYFNHGPGSGKLYLVQKAVGCSDTTEVGSVDVTCPEGAVAKKMHFKIAMPVKYR
jgi:hypothetical protein